MSMSPDSDNVDGNGGPEHRPQWYDHGAVFFGNIWVHRAAASIYGVVALLPLVLWAGSESQIEVSRRVALLWAAFVALGWPAWVWLETISFERWVRSRPQAHRTLERAYFKLMTDNAKAFWAAVIAVYAAAAAIGFKPLFK